MPKNEKRVLRSAPRTLAVAAIAAASLAASTPALASGSAPARDRVAAVETADVTASGLPRKCALKVQAYRYLSQGMKPRLYARATIKCQKIVGVRVDVTLFKGKKAMKTKVCEKHSDWVPGKPKPKPKPKTLSCSKAIDMADKYKGKQTWQAKAEGEAYRVGENGSASKWSKKVKS